LSNLQGYHTFAGMVVSDSLDEKTRRTEAYRAAVWVGRLYWVWALAYIVCMLAWFLTPSIRHAVGPLGSLVIPLPWVVGVPLLVARGALLRRLGVKLTMIRRQFYRDVFWLSRP
jgi:hypothetical protein